MSDDRRSIDQEPAPPHIRLLRSHWPEVGNRVGWTPRFTPGLPAAWPSRRPRLVWYGFAYGYSRFPPDHLVDAVEVGCLWGRVEQRVEEGGGAGGGESGARSSLDFTALSETVEAVGVQGVRPMGPDDDVWESDLQRAERRMAGRFAGRVGRRDIAAYAGWLSNHGAIVELLPGEHAAFLDWIRSRAHGG